MNSEFPPIQFSAPVSKRRRRERRGFDEPPGIPPEQRREISQRFRQEIDHINAELRQRSPDERRAIFFKLTHDRYLRRQDLAGTGLAMMAPGEEESLVVARKNSLDKLDERLAGFGAGEDVDRPKGSDFATKVRSVAIADARDRLSPELLDRYSQLTQETHVIYEIEVSSFALLEKTRRREIAECFEEITRALASGIHGAIYEKDTTSSGARAVLWSTGAKFREFVENPNWWKKIVFFDERPRFETFAQTYSSFNVGSVGIEAPGTGAETICVIDSGIAAGNPFLAPVILRDISRSFGVDSAATEDDYGHGSGVASLAAYYQIDTSEGAQHTAEAFVASARIMTDVGQLDIPQMEDADADRTQQARLLSNILREVVEFYTPRGIRIFLLAFQIEGHVWSRAHRRFIARNSWVARTIDELSAENDAVFVTITGNLTLADVAGLRADQDYPHYIMRPVAKVLDPGNAAVAVCVGSIAHSTSVVASSMDAIAMVGEPSPFTRSGPGMADSIKPDFVERGGNLVADRSSGAVAANLGTDVVMASGRLSPALQHNTGSSFAAPRVAHQLAILLRDLKALGVNPTASLLRAFLAGSASLPAAASQSPLERDQRLAVFGYGIPDARRATDCSPNSAVLFWQGNLRVDTCSLFRLPVPVELARAGRTSKRIVVSIAAAPPVQQWGVEDYIGAPFKFAVYRGDRDYASIEALTQLEEGESNVAAGNGVENISGVLGINRRSNGTLQRDDFRWTDHREEFSTDFYTIALSIGRAKWCAAEEEISVAVVVRVEDEGGGCPQLYSRVRASIQATARARS